MNSNGKQYNGNLKFALHVIIHKIKTGEIWMCKATENKVWSACICNNNIAKTSKSQYIKIFFTCMRDKYQNRELMRGIQKTILDNFSKL